MLQTLLQFNLELIQPLPVLVVSSEKVVAAALSVRVQDGVCRLGTEPCCLERRQSNNKGPGSSNNRSTCHCAPYGCPEHVPIIVSVQKAHIGTQHSQLGLP